MSVSYYESRVSQAQRDVERYRKKQADLEAKAAKEAGEARRRRQSAGDTKSDSLRRSYLRQADRHEAAALKARTAAASESARVNSAQTKLLGAERRLDQEREKQAEKREREEQRRRAEAERHAATAQAQRDQRQQQQMDALATRATRLERQLRQAAPPEITVLFVCASPDDQQPLRIDQEVREIQRRIRESDHRDSVRLEWRPAARPEDLLQALNEVKPHVVHFSGHGAQRGLAFENADGKTRVLSNDQLGALLATSSDRIRLAVFNSCESAEQAGLACQHIDAAIGMELPISDAAAKIFAGQLYNSIGFGKSLQHAFEQAKLQIELALGSASGDAALHTTPSLDPAEILLVSGA